MIISSLVITVVGMSVVFAFLVLLVYIIKLLSAIVLRISPEEEEKIPASASAEIAIAVAAAYAKR